MTKIIACSCKFRKNVFHLKLIIVAALHVHYRCTNCSDELQTAGTEFLATDCGLLRSSINNAMLSVGVDSPGYEYNIEIVCPNKRSVAVSGC